jgi:hypothetical protein
VPAGADTWLAITFAGNTSTTYAPHITLSTNPGNEYLFDVLTSCTTDAAPPTLACGIEATTSTGVSAWSVSFTGVDPNAPADSPTNYGPIPPVGSGGTVIIHVYRAASAPVDCNSYVLTIGN